MGCGTGGVLRVRCLLSVGCVWAGEQSLLVLLPHDEHLQRQRRRGEKRRLRADKRLTSERERQCGNACLCIRLHSYRKSCQNRPAAETHTGLHIEGLGPKKCLCSNPPPVNTQTLARVNIHAGKTLLCLFFSRSWSLRVREQKPLTATKTVVFRLDGMYTWKPLEPSQVPCQKSSVKYDQRLDPSRVGWCCLSTLSVSRNNCRVLGRWFPTTLGPSEITRCTEGNYPNLPNWTEKCNLFHAND